ncbi:MAG TPA: Gfo/Idh/MocA family oxidoreductase [Anaerolineales bacterium]|nr:Gfo/Idh/MocA family oxidoreductase [Anaerolineales bacterium]
MPEGRAIRFGIIGCGGAAEPVCQAIAASPLAELVMLHDLNLDLARDLAERFHAPFTGALDQLLAHPTLDAVYVAVPHHQLAPLARKALEAGKHALVEKPLALTLVEADALIALAEAQRLALGVFYELRHTTAHRQARELVQAGAIGEVIGVRLQTLIDKPQSYWQSGWSGRWTNPWRGRKDEAGGGVVLMNTSHFLDAVRYITGLEVVDVSAEVGTLAANVEVEDTAAATLRFNNGALGSLFAGAHIPGARRGDEHFDIYGAQGQLRLPDPYGDDPLQVFLRRDWGGLPAGRWQALPGAPAPVYVEAIEAFARAVQQGQAPPTGGRDARQVLAIVLAIYQAAAEKRTMILSRSEATYA